MRINLLAVFALVWASSGVAQPALETPDYRAMGDNDLRVQVLAIVNDAFRDPCGSNLRLFAELSKRDPSHIGYKSGALTAQALCALQERRYEDSLILVRKAENVQTVPILDTIGLDLATKMQDGSEALARLRKIAFDGRLRYLGKDLLFAGVRTIRAAGLNDALDDFSYELTASSGFARLETDVRASFAVAALRHAAKVTDFSRVQGLLDHIAPASEYVKMSADPAFEALWPAIKQRIETPDVQPQSR